MKRFGLSLISLFVLVGLSGCATYDVLKLGIIDKNDKSILIPSSGILSMIEIKKMLIKNGWKFTASSSSRNTSGTTLGNSINLNTVNLTKSRYRMYITETNRMNQFVLTIHVSIIDNTTQEEVLSLFGDSTGAGGVFPSSTAKELEQALQEMETIKLQKKPKKNGESFTVIHIDKETYLQGNIMRYISSDKKLNGQYQVFSEKYPRVYAITEFIDGLRKSKKIYFLNDKLVSSLIYDNGIAIKEKRFNKNQLLFLLKIDPLF